MSSFLVDSNIFIYAADEDIPQFKIAKETLLKAANTNEEWCISWQNVYEYLSIVTNRKVFHGKPLGYIDAIGNMNAVLSLANVRVIYETENHWQAFQTVLNLVRNVEGAFIYDCKLAAVMKENEVYRIITADEGFRRFHFLKIENPFLSKRL